MEVTTGKGERRGVQRSWIRVVGGEGWRGSQEPGHRGFPGQLCYVTSGKLLPASSAKKKPWSLGSWSLRLLLLLPSRAPAIRTRDRAGSKKRGTAPGPSRVRPLPGWGGRWPQQAKGWGSLANKSPPHRSAQAALVRNRDPGGCGNIGRQADMGLRPRERSG